nr:hypothetical protein [Tanacetum cinerariifolium]
MASFDYRLNPLYPIKECSSCGALYTMDYCCSEGRCALLRKKFKEDLFTYYIENGILPDSSEPPNDNTNVVNALQEPFVVKQDPGKNSSQSPPQINHHCCYGCGDPLEDIFCHQYTCELCGNGAHYSYNCPPKVSIVPNSNSFNNQTVDELPQTLPSFDPTCYSEDGNSFTYDSNSNLVNDSPNVFDPHSQPPLYSCEFCGNDAQEEKQIEEEQAARYWKIPACYDDDDGDDYTIAITHKEPDNSLKFISENSDAAFKSFFPSAISIEDNDSLIEEIDLSFTPDDPMPPGIEEDDYDSERDILIL